MNKQAVSSKSVAKLAGVSQATVSRVINHHPNVSPQMQERVLKAVKQLGYMPNAMAQGLISNRSNLIAVVLKEMENPFFQNVLNRIEYHTAKIGKSVLFFNLSNGNSIDKILESALHYRVEGIIITSGSIPEELVARSKQYNIPVVAFNCRFEEYNIFSVCSDNVTAGREMARHLIALQYLPAIYIGCNENVELRYRLSGFMEEMRRQDCTPETFSVPKNIYEVGYTETLKALQRVPNCRAIAYSNDLLAFGGMDAIREKLRLSIPEDIAVIGFDDVTASVWKNYSLTTFQQSVDDMVTHVMKYLLDRQNGLPREDEEHVVTLFPCKLIRRSTT